MKRTLSLTVLMLFLLVGAARAQDYPPSFSDLVKRVAPAVVNIDVATGMKVTEPGGIFPRQNRVQKGQGSGFVIGADGYIVTNNHVVRNTDQIVVRLSDKRAFPAKIVGTDPKTDLALLKIEATDLPHLNFGDSDQLQVGEWVIAIGNPLGFSHTVTAGIVSAKGRWIGATQYDDFIQTDASINPGNSGGPLINVRGEVVGINTLIAAGQGLGFAIPSNLAGQIIGQLRENGQVQRSWLGVRHQDVTPELAESFGLERPVGALIVQVVEDSPAQSAGLEAGDIIVEFDGKPTEDSRDLPLMVASKPIGSRVDLVVIREGKRRKFNVKLGDLADATGEPVIGGPTEEQPEKATAILGMELAEITPELARALGVQPGRGVLIKRVRPLGPAARKGLAQDDIVLKINADKVSSAKKAVALIQRVPEGKLVRLLVQRGDYTFFVTLPR